MWKRTTGCLSTSVRIACSCRFGITSGSLWVPALPVFFQFWQYEHLIIDDVVQRIGDPRLVLRLVRGGGERVWVWSDPDFEDGPSDYLHAVRFASQELGRRFHDEWAATG